MRGKENTQRQNVGIIRGNGSKRTKSIERLRSEESEAASSTAAAATFADFIIVSSRPATSLRIVNAILIVMQQ